MRWLRCLDFDSIKLRSRPDFLTRARRTARSRTSDKPHRRRAAANQAAGRSLHPCSSELHRVEETTCGGVSDLARVGRQGKGKCQQSSHAIFSTAFPRSQSLTHVPLTLHRNDREDSGETFSPCRTCLLPSPASTHLSPSERRPQPRYEVSLLPALASFGLLSSRPSFKPAFFQAGLLSPPPSLRSLLRPSYTPSSIVTSNPPRSSILCRRISPSGPTMGLLGQPGSTVGASSTFHALLQACQVASLHASLARVVWFHFSRPSIYHGVEGRMEEAVSKNRLGHKHGRSWQEDGKDTWGKKEVDAPRSSRCTPCSNVLY